jgi:ribosomal protein S18 acetylase RimI-like enzyme
MEEEIAIRFIEEKDLVAFKTLRLEALRDCPEAFGSDYEENLKHPDSFWAERIGKAARHEDQSIVVGEAGGELAGMVGVFRNSGAKCRHAAGIWGVYVRPNYRGRDLARRMMDAAMGWCRESGIRIVRLTVNSENRVAIGCYEKCGFAVSGRSLEEIRVGEKYFDELLMWKRV